ncbi:MAG: AGE family epimerase/isomerase [Saprospiraceae bacterium]|nr:AGE family epimerase/isomerase [Saprospiraceae bacterium]
MDYTNLYRTSLLEDVMPFWVKYSPDREHGGFFTCLDQQGAVYDTDKFIWLQCREVWTLSMLYDSLEKDPVWLDLAIQGAEFLLKYGRDKQGDWYFSLRQDGQPLVQPFNIFSDCFAAMAFARLYKVTGDDRYRQVAKDTFENIIARQDNPKGKYEKTFPGTRPMQSFALPMILSNLVLEVESLIDAQLVEDTINNSIEKVLNVFYQPDLKVILENVGEHAKRIDSFEGRLVCPGHGLEAMWFLMDLAERNENRQLMEKAVDISLQLMDYGWDTLYGGLFYFLDVKGYPPEKLEWDQKLWWVHQESMLAMLKGYYHTGNEDCWRWFEKLHKYSWDHFADMEYGEWFGNLNRRGETLLLLKGGKWKGCFHTPRFLFQAASTLTKILVK